MIFFENKTGKIKNSISATVVSSNFMHTVDSLINGHHRGNDFRPLIGGVRLLESLIFLTFCGLGKGNLKVLSF